MRYDEERSALRMLIRLRDDMQAMRKRCDNRIGRKADGTDQDIEERKFRVEDFTYFQGTADYTREQEALIEKMLLQRLKEFPIYTEFLKGVKGIGPVAAAWIIAEIDIYKADTVSKIWQFCGLNPGLVPGKKRVEKGKTFICVPSGQMVRGDKLTPGHVSPFNQRLRTALVGVLADGFIKAQAPYALDYYYPYKARLEQEENKISGEDKAWNEVSKGRRDRAAKRYMIKMFLKDLYDRWRRLEGLPVRAPYQDEYLGHKHEKEMAAV